MIKAFTDLEQSRKLAEILPIESADMRYVPFGDTHPWVWDEEVKLLENGSVPCRSLAALLSIASTYCNRLEITLRTNKKYNVFAVKGDFVFRSFDKCSDGYDDLADACVAMIEKLHELKML